MSFLFEIETTDKSVLAYRKTKKVILSCKTKHHIGAAAKMITNFGMLYGRDNSWLVLHSVLTNQIIKLS